MPTLRPSLLRSPQRGARWGEVSRGTRLQYTYSGRTALHQFFARGARAGLFGARRTVLVPAFHCPTIVDPLEHAGFECRFYRVDPALGVDRDDLLAKLDPRVAAVVFVRFYGIVELDPTLAAAVRAAGACVVEDCAHSFLSDAPLRPAGLGADVAIYSFWKLVPSAVGGGIGFGTERWASALPPPWSGLVGPPVLERSRRIRRLASEVVDALRSRDALRAPPPEREADQAQPTPVAASASDAYPYDADGASWRMPATARWVLEHTDLSRVAEVRRTHYRSYVHGLTHDDAMRPMIPVLPSTACPWGLPLWLPDRARRDYRIRARGVPLFTFGEILHPLLAERHAGERRMLDDARLLSESVLGLAVHQDLSDGDVATFADRVVSEGRR